jgi:serine/threonine-protein kinase
MLEVKSAATLGPYQLVSAIGSGGMGQVWVALDTAAPALRLVALKTALSSDSASDRDFWTALTDEAALASRIQHPNVCSTFELGEQAGLHYLVMEWSDGASLRDLLDALPQRRLAPELAAYITLAIAAGLHAAHELADEKGHALGVVHRDVSPQNILISMRGHVRLADFGVAKARGQQHRPTETGEVKGKLSYMAPEQVTSKNIDRRADVFALGCVLYEAALGARPFHGADAMATMYRILEGELVSPRLSEPSFPEALEAIISRALAKDPAERYQSADEFRQALLDYLGSTRKYIGDKHVAEALRNALGSKLVERNSAIMTAAERLRRGETDPEKLGSPPPPPPPKTLTPDHAYERSVTRKSEWRGAPIRRLAAALVLASIVVLAFAGRRFEKRTPSTPAAVPKTAASSAQPRPPAAPQPAPAEATSKVLVAAPSVMSSAPRLNAPKARRPSSASAQPVRPVAEPALATSAAKPPSGKKPRPIDRSNPFAN